MLKKMIHKKDKILLSTGGARTFIHFDSRKVLTRLLEPRRTVIVADELTKAFIPEAFSDSPCVIVAGGEEAKSLKSIERLWAEFLALGVERNWTVLAIGGGSVLDLAGFAASTWLRGIEFAFVPSTLLAMVDASIGGKNGINFLGKKNQIGCIRQPRFVLVDIGLLEGLPAERLADGFVEAIKHGILDGEKHLKLTEKAISDKSPESLKAVIMASVLYKASIVKRDEREHNVRRLLNLGHSFGHGIEAVTGLSHGQAVSVGLACALRLARERGAAEGLETRVLAILKSLGLATGLEEARNHPLNTNKINRETFNLRLIDAIAHDKKRNAKDILFVLPFSPGDIRVEAIALSELEDFCRRAQ